MPDSEVKPVVEETFLTRLRAEHEELVQRVVKLTAFIDTTPFYALTTDDQTDLRVQLTYMQGYVGILARRLNRITAHH